MKFGNLVTKNKYYIEAKQSKAKHWSKTKSLIFTMCFLEYLPIITDPLKKAQLARERDIINKQVIEINEQFDKRKEKEKEGQPI